MATEIERKFLVGDTAFLAGHVGKPLKQAYLASGNAIMVRVRIAGAQAWLTLKGPTVGRSRPEFEYEIPRSDARELMELAPHAPIVEKTRFRIPREDLVWEVDVFQGANAGLVTAEVELENEDQQIAVPPWIEREVTEDARYANANLALRPYREWSDEQRSG
ncbi:MAG: CYTH domain-containing protein [Pseudomonadales bacterium]